MGTTDPIGATLHELAARYREGEFDPLAVTEAFLDRPAPPEVVRVATPSRARAQAAASSKLPTTSSRSAPD